MPAPSDPEIPVLATRPVDSHTPEHKGDSRDVYCTQPVCCEQRAEVTGACYMDHGAAHSGTQCAKGSKGDRSKHKSMRPDCTNGPRPAASLTPQVLWLSHWPWAWSQDLLRSAGQYRSAALGAWERARPHLLPSGLPAGTTRTRSGWPGTRRLQGQVRHPAKGSNVIKVTHSWLRTHRWALTSPEP